MNAVNPPLRSCWSRIRCKCSTRSSIVSTWPNIIVAQDLNAARRRKFVQFLVDLLERENVMVFVFFRSVKRAELAVNIANVRVIDVAIDNVGHNLAPMAVVTFSFCQIASRLRQCAELFQGHSIKLQGL